MFLFLHIPGFMYELESRHMKKKVQTKQNNKELKTL